MSKYDTGKYVLTLFDERGKKLDQKQLDTEGLLASQKLGYQMVRDGSCHSFNVHRNLFNSLDGAQDNFMQSICRG